MWNPTHRRKNLYLQSRINIMNPALLNQCVETTKIRPYTILSKKKILNSQLIPAAPKCFGPTISQNKARLAYGLWGLPKLLREVCSKDTATQIKAIYSLTNLLKNSLECNRAIYDFDVVNKLEEVLLRALPETRETLDMINKILMCFATLATHYEGSWRMVGLCDLTDTLYSLIKNSQCIKSDAAEILMIMSSHTSVADVMLMHGHLKRILEVLRFVEDSTNLYIHLANLIKRAPIAGMEAGFFDFLISRICIENNVQSLVIKCLALLLSTPEGHELFDKIDGVNILYNMLKNENYSDITLQYVALAMQNCTISKNALWRCREFWDLPLILIRLAHSRTNDFIQLYCLQTLRQITTMPSVKSFVQKNCKKQIKSIEYRQEFVKKTKQRLLEWLRKKNYQNIESNIESDLEREKTKSDKSSDESESESFCSKRTSDISSTKYETQIGKDPRPIAYRLNYGKICHEKMLSPSQLEYDNVHEKYKEINLPISKNVIHKNVKQTDIFIGNAQQSSVYVVAKGLENEGGPNSLAIVESLNTMTYVASRRRRYEKNDNIKLMKHATAPPLNPIKQNLIYPKPNEVPLHFDLMSNQAYPISHSISRVIPFINEVQRTAFIKSPPKSKTFYALTKGPIPQQIKTARRAAISLEHQESSY